MNLDYTTGTESIKDYSVIYERYNKTAQEDQRLGMLSDKYAVDEAQGAERLKQGARGLEIQARAADTALSTRQDKQRVLAMETSIAQEPHLYHEGGMMKVLMRAKESLDRIPAPDAGGWFGKGIVGGESPGSVMSQLDEENVRTVGDVESLMWKHRDKIPGGSALTTNQFQSSYIDPLRKLYQEGIAASAAKRYGIGTMFSKYPLASATPASSVTPTKTQKQSAQNKKVNQEKIENHQQSVKIQNAFEAPLNPTHSVDGVPAVPSSQSDINDVQDVSQSSNAIQLIGQQLSQLNTMDELDAFAEQVSQNQQKVQPPPSQNDINKVQQMFLLRYEEVNSRQRG